MSRLFCFGLGYCAAHLARRLQAAGWRIAGTSRSQEGVEKLRAAGFEACLFQAGERGSAVGMLLPGTTHLLVSVPPVDAVDVVLRQFAPELATLRELRWVGYLSTVGVYGGEDGIWVSEATPPRPTSARTRARLEAEQDWLAFGARHAVAVHIFRLAGIYGPGRNAFEALRAGTARRIVKPGQVFNRVHVADVANVLEASIARPRGGAIYNVADDEPAPPQDVVAHAAELMGVAPPPEIAIEEAELSPLARSFYDSCQRVSNRRIKEELGVRLSFPSYREGLRALLPERSAPI